MTNEKPEHETEVSREDIEAASLSSTLLGIHLARPDGRPAPAAENWRMMRDAAKASRSSLLPAVPMSPWWREALKAFRDTRTSVRFWPLGPRSSSSVRSPFSVDMIHAFLDERAEMPAVYRSTDPGQP